MTLTKMLILSLALSVPSCVSQTNSCAGWEKIQTDQAATLEWLAAQDPDFLRQVTAHDEFGAGRGCWK